MIGLISIIIKLANCTNAKETAESFNMLHEITSITNFLKTMLESFFDLEKLSSPKFIFLGIVLLITAAISTYFIYFYVFINYNESSHKSVFENCIFIFLLSWASFLLYYSISFNRGATFIANITWDWKFPQILILVISISITLLIIFILLIIFDFMANNIIEALFLLSSTFAIILIFFTGVSFSTAFFGIFIVLFTDLSFLVFADTLEESIRSLEISDVFIMFFKLSHYLIPFFTISSFINCFQMKLIKSAISTGSSKNIIDLFSLNNFSGSAKMFVLLCLLSWTHFILKNFSKIYFCCVFKCKADSNSIDLMHVFEELQYATKQVVYNSFFSALLFSFEIFFGISIFLKSASLDFGMKSVLYCSLAGVIGFVSSFIRAYDFKLFSCIGLDLESKFGMSSYSYDTNVTYNFEVLQNSSEFDIAGSSKITFLSFIPHVIALNLFLMLPEKYSVYISILFICMDISLDLISVIYSSFFIAKNIQDNNISVCKVSTYAPESMLGPEINIDVETSVVNTAES